MKHYYCEICKTSKEDWIINSKIKCTCIMDEHLESLDYAQVCESCYKKVKKSIVTEVIKIRTQNTIKE